MIMILQTPARQNDRVLPACLSVCRSIHSRGVVPLAEHEFVPQVLRVPLGLLPPNGRKVHHETIGILKFVNNHLRTQRVSWRCVCCTSKRSCLDSQNRTVPIKTHCDKITRHGTRPSLDEFNRVVLFDPVIRMLLLPCPGTEALCPIIFIVLRCIAHRTALRHPCGQSKGVLCRWLAGGCQLMPSGGHHSGII